MAAFLDSILTPRRGAKDTHHMQSLIDTIKAFNAPLLPDKVQLKYSFMAENPYRFYRGTCHLYAHYLAGMKLPPSPTVWASGDLHLENFGSFLGCNSLVYFDLNDFDEAILAPAVWEITRMVSSIFIAFDTLQIEEEKANRMARLFIKTYIETLQKGKAQYMEPRIAQGIIRDFLLSAARRKPNHLLRKKTIRKKGRISLFLDTDKHQPVDKPTKKKLKAFITDWIQHHTEAVYGYKVADIVFRIAGTGSVGVRRYAVLLKGQSKTKKYLLLDMKQAKTSSLEPFTHQAQPDWPTEAERVVTIQKIMQNVSPSLLSTCEFEGDAYVLQEMQPTKDNINFSLLRDDYRGMYQVISDMALLTASSQLRCSGYLGSATIDELIAFAGRKNIQEKIWDISRECGRLSLEDYRAFREAFDRGEFAEGQLPAEQAAAA